jgi:hypothetical protein
MVPDARIGSMRQLTVHIVIAGLMIAGAHAADPADFAAASEHWAFRPVVRPPLPMVKDRSWGCNTIDRFILARLELEGVKPAPPADRPTLLRRLSLDLTGLPPAFSDIDRFVEDDRAGAYERCVERLLAAPSYGERWGRHWLDAAGYADSGGSESDDLRPLWKYRDWVIGALNRDLPFDRFVVEQLAGDLLPGATAEQEFATGFLCTPIYDGVLGQDERLRVQVTIDRVNLVGTTFLGLTLGCAQCHSHKFDPISQREYYQLFAFFDNIEEAEWELAPVEKTVKSLKNQQPNLHKTRVVRESAKPRTTRVLRRGEFSQPGDPVAPGGPAVLPPISGVDRKTRLDFARWLVKPDHPLTARVVVNRVWAHYFGMGLVPTDDNFGLSGDPPSHPELLDWLAAEFMAQGWSLKALHRLIVGSATYQQSSHARLEMAEIDPSNRLLARQSRLRLEAEAIRDAALTASGLLFERIGGPSVFPYQPEGVMNGRADKGVWVESAGGDRYRRGVYTHFWRLTPHPFLRLFDAPDASSACTRRIRTNTPLQALTLLNDPAFTECAEALADRVIKDVPQGGPARIRHAFLLCLCREPTAAESRKVETYLAAEQDRAIARAAESESPTGEPGKSAGRGRTARDPALVGLARALLNLDEFITRE